MSVFTQAELDAWERDGYIVLREAVSKAQCDAVVDATWEFLEMDPDDSSTWYSLPPWHARTGMVEMYHHQSMWDTRQAPRIHAAFSQLFGTEKLLLRIVDRVNMNPPVREEHDYKGFIHWDFEPYDWPIPLMVQGVLLLRDTDAEQGGFQCVPGSHLEVDRILGAQPKGSSRRTPDIGDREVRPVPGQAGDLVIWHTALLHGNGPNLTDKPRLAQYIAMRRAEPDDPAHREELVQAWHRRAPMGFRHPVAFPADPRYLDERQPEPACLTPLGRRLVGLDDWD